MRLFHQTLDASGEGLSTPNPLLSLKLPAHRSRLVLLGLLLGFLVLSLRAVWLQVVSQEYLQQQGASRYARTLALPGVRGKILDRNGVLLASSLPAQAVWGEPEEMLNTTPKQRRYLAKVLQISVSELNKKIQMTERNFVYLKRQIDPDLAKSVASMKLPGVYTQGEYKRHYPEGEALAHVVGFTNVEDVGQEGIELAKNAELAGRSGRRRVIRDRAGQTVEDVGIIEAPQSGGDLELSIDAKIQFLAFDAIRTAVRETQAKAGAAVVLDAWTGEILALTSWPTYDPNARENLKGEQLRNRAITDTFEPGSTMKPLTVALALDLNRATPGSIVQTGEGHLTMGSHTIHDTHAHGALTVAQIIQKSSNIGAAKLALDLPARKMWDFFRAVGFGQAPQVGFPGAVAGRLKPYQTWRPIEQATMGYGYGLSVSLLQMAGAYTPFANEGNRVALSMFRRQKSGGEKVRIMRADTAKSVLRMLEMVTEPGGTAQLARVPGYRVGGKTGTAYKREGGKYVKKYLASFVGLAPISNPRVVVAVMIDEPRAGGHYGGKVAAPVFSEITGGTLRALGVSLDLPIVYSDETNRQAFLEGN